ncbi:DNA polymerase epsilon subunit, putative [Babesia ovata]|uniref:DNA polymerase epsilon subunit, putative n=1 Tax=Babesia ovata TaxID=189622 RepID=A0A2H6KK05_9APIC|nr:DNA polymerase epsilon subunit, putative [Babesia ovata]GBE63324.1 DNA polymerase epsilon subunit, putative [Babesia ovata]
MRIWVEDADGGGDGRRREGAKRPVKEGGERMGAYPQDVEADDGDVQQVEQREGPEGEEGIREILSYLPDEFIDLLD